MKKFFLFSFILFVSALFISLGKQLFSEPVSANHSSNYDTNQLTSTENHSADKKDVIKKPQTLVESNQARTNTADINLDTHSQAENDSTQSHSITPEGDTPADELLINEAKLAGYDPSKDYRYASEVLTKAMDGLKNLNELHKNHANLSEESVQAVWKSVDAAVAENTISPVEGIRHKKWLSSLVNSTQLKQQLETDMAKVNQQLQADAQAAREEQANDPKFIQYKAEEERLTQEILAKYPNDSIKAAAELDEALNKVRTQIYQ